MASEDAPRGMLEFLCGTSDERLTILFYRHTLLQQHFCADQINMLQMSCISKLNNSKYSVYNNYFSDTALKAQNLQLSSIAIRLYFVPRNKQDPPSPVGVLQAHAHQLSREALTVP